MEAITYPSGITTDKEKLYACYSLIEQMRLEHNRQGEIARKNSTKYLESGKWYQYALRPTRLGGNIFWKEMMPLLQEQNRLRDNIRKAHYTDKQWGAMPIEDRLALFTELFGDKEAEKTKPTKATFEPLDSLKLISLDTLEIESLDDPVENFTTYTEVDEDGDITVTATKCDVSTMRRDAVSYVRKSMGSGHFGDFEHLITLYLGGYSATTGTGGFWGVTDGYSTIQDCLVNNDGILAWTGGWDVSGHYVTLYDCTNDDYDQYTASGTSPPITHYCTIERASTTATCKIYSDASRDTLVDTLTLTCGTGTYQWIHAILSRDDAGTPDPTITYYSENLDLQEEVVSVPRHGFVNFQVPGIV